MMVSGLRAMREAMAGLESRNWIVLIGERVNGKQRVGSSRIVNQISCQKFFDAGCRVFIISNCKFRWDKCNGCPEHIRIVLCHLQDISKEISKWRFLADIIQVKITVNFLPINLEILKAANVSSE